MICVFKNVREQDIVMMAKWRRDLDYILSMPFSSVRKVPPFRMKKLFTE